MVVLVDAVIPDSVGLVFVSGTTVHVVIVVVVVFAVVVVVVVKFQKTNALVHFSVRLKISPP